MSELAQLVNALRRPRLLLQAVRHGIADYQREKTLRRIIGASVPGPRKAVAMLMLTEELLETARRSREASYSVTRHVEVLIALVAEARSLSSEAARAEREAARILPLRRAAVR